MTGGRGIAQHTIATRWTVPSTNAVTGKAWFTQASAATAVVELMAKWSNLCPPTVFNFIIDL